MASTINTTYKRFNGTDWDTIYLKTTASQVIESTSKRFLVPNTHSVNGKYFFTTTDGNGVAQGITLYGSDIFVDNSTNAPTIAAQIASIITSITDVQSNYLKVSDASNTYLPLSGGDLTGDISPVAMGATNLGTSSKRFSKVYASTFIGSLEGNASTATKATTADSATQAEKDGNGLIISENYIKNSQKGVAGGIATLDNEGKVLTSQLPSYVDDVVEYASQSKFPSTGESGKIYVDITDNRTYRWSGTKYVEISSSLALGETASTAYRGDLGKANTDAIIELQNAINNFLPLSGGELTGTLTTDNIFASSSGLQIGSEITPYNYIFANYFKGSLDGNASTATRATTADNATKASQDGDGNVISSTYLKLSGGTVTGKVDFSTRPSFKASASSTVYHTHNIIFYGSSAPDGAQTGDIWLAIS